MRENPWQPPFQPGTLWTRILDATERGRNTGSLLPIPTTFVEIPELGIPFVVRVVDNLRRKQEAQRSQAREGKRSGSTNPFLPCDRDLYVADVSDSHLAVLNKFNVIDHHVLIITRDFQEQEKLLTMADFHALWRCLREVKGLAFYNGGVVAGASQKHKHIQLAPFPIIKGLAGVPIEQVVRDSLNSGVSRVEVFPFAHTIEPIEGPWRRDIHQAACETHRKYIQMLITLGIWRGSEEPMQSSAYNLLMTQDWMMMVPRTEEICEGMSINAIGYGGGLLVRNEAELQRVRELGPMHFLVGGGLI